MASKTAHFGRYLETVGNGPPVRIQRIPGISPRMVRSANTTVSSCATNTCCVADPALRLEDIYEQVIETFFRPTLAGNSQVCDSPNLSPDQVQVK